MIVREIEVCPQCGQYDPWRKYSTRTIRGQRRIYVKCKRCGLRDVVVYKKRDWLVRTMEKSENGTPSGERSPSG